MQVGLSACSLAFLVTLSAVGCGRVIKDGVVARLECCPEEQPARPWFRCTMENRGSAAVLLEREQMLPEIALQVFDLAGARLPGLMCPFPLSAAERQYLVLGPGEHTEVVFPATLLLHYREHYGGYVVRYNYHPS